MQQTNSMKRFEEAALGLVEKHKIPGTAVGIARNGQLVYEKGFGYRNIDKQLPVTPDTVFGIGSITKSMTCVAILQLQEAGKLNVHDPVKKYLPEFSTKDVDKTNRMTIHHFMTHSAGLPPLSSLVYAMKRSMEIDPSVKDYSGLQVEGVEQGPIDTYEQLMEFIDKQEFELLGEPGTRFSYSNDSYALLGAIITRVSGQSYESYMKEFMFEPIGMTQTAFLVEELNEEAIITMSYAADKEENGQKKVYEAPIWWDATSMRAAGFVKSTVRDMLRFAEVFRNGGLVEDKQILTEESVKAIITPYIETQPGRYYGYGLMITPDYNGATLIEHGGNLKAIAAQMSIIPEKGITGVVLTNLAAVPASTIMEYGLNDFQGLPVNSGFDIDEYDLSQEQLEAYAGEYVSSEGMKVTIGFNDRKPTFTSQGEVYPIKAITENSFLAVVNDMKEMITIINGGNGEIWGISYHFREFPKRK
jgi:CubicO group peptidase (beta-lactamase class C family)